MSGAYVSGDKLGIRLSTTAKKTSRPGKYPISVSWNKNTNYEAALKKGTYTITDRLTAAESSRARIRLNAGFKAGLNSSSLQVEWGKVQDAELYEIRAAYCGKEMKTVRKIKGNGVTSFKITELDGKKIDLTKNFKVRVFAYRKVNGKLTRISSTLVGHVTGGRGRTAAYTNVKKVSVSKNSHTLKPGGTAKIQAEAVLNNPAKKQLSDRHSAEFRYISDNKGVAAVGEDGTITAAGKGTCSIYVFARNGVHTKVTVTVK